MPESIFIIKIYLVMNTSTMITLAIIIAIIIVLYMVISTNRKNKEKKKLQMLTDLASKQNCNITKYELYSKISLGLDEKNNFLFYLKTTGENAETRHINLTEVKKCKVVNTSRTVRFNTVIRLWLKGWKSVLSPTVKLLNLFCLNFTTSILTVQC